MVWGDCEARSIDGAVRPRPVGKKRRGKAYLMVPVVISWTGSTTTPFTTHFEMLNTERTVAHMMKTVESAR
jgi:hypothetical protein